MGKTEERDVVCPHCNKAFRGEVIAGETPRAGFKCPHCRLFFPLERVELADAAPQPGLT